VSGWQGRAFSGDYHERAPCVRHGRANSPRYPAATRHHFAAAKETAPAFLGRSSVISRQRPRQAEDGKGRSVCASAARSLLVEGRRAERVSDLRGTARALCCGLRDDAPSICGGPAAAPAFRGQSFALSRVSRRRGWGDYTSSPSNTALHRSWMLAERAFAQLVSV
jgi:hypothetical protein